ncbi:uncharacterized protein LOC125943860 [Dermacentor silvarum]|uniref:uncharacterized protein LOC125943860 n=1 Tax=Dermacentor silvarum TaxID=543639 RepID=UPI002100DB4C|nr:uncharacterized protein LOC125943860 [Dermacentor silvarum]
MRNSSAGLWSSSLHAETSTDLGRLEPPVSPADESGPQRSSSRRLRGQDSKGDDALWEFLGLAMSVIFLTTVVTVLALTKALSEPKRIRVKGNRSAMTMWPSPVTSAQRRAAKISAPLLTSNGSASALRLHMDVEQATPHHSRSPKWGLEMPSH